MPISEGQITVRLPQDLLDRIDDLIDPVSELPEYRALRITRSVVLRLALDSGLDVLENHLEVAKPKARGRKRRRR
jgi:metal-responsive CopG/Arc/MetJ family transcriptional regulator